MTETKYYADITAKYKDSNGVIRFSDFKSKRKGSTFNQIFGGMVIAGYSVLSDNKIQEWWDEGKIQKNIERLRIMDIESGGVHGLSKTYSLRLYKIIFDKLRGDQLKQPIITFDNFSRRELGLDERYNAVTIK